MATVSMRRMLEAGVHFGHQTRFWNPKMAPYIFGQRSKIHIINLEKTVPLFEDALNFLEKSSSEGSTVLFVGTKRAARDLIAREAVRCNMPYADQRWLGGTLTNFATVRRSVKRLLELEGMEEDGLMERLIKKEAVRLRREHAKLDKSLGGLRNMDSLPDVLFVVDVGYENIAVAEANKLHIPVIGIVDTNNSPIGIDYVIPGNDDAISAIDVFLSAAADAILTGREMVPVLQGNAEDFVAVEEIEEITARRAKSSRRTAVRKSIAADTAADIEPQVAADGPQAVTEPAVTGSRQEGGDEKSTPVAAVEPDPVAAEPRQPDDAA